MRNSRSRRSLMGAVGLVLLCFLFTPTGIAFG